MKRTHYATRTAYAVLLGGALLGMSIPASATAADAGEGALSAPSVTLEVEPTAELAASPIASAIAPTTYEYASDAPNPNGRAATCGFSGDHTYLVKGSAERDAVMHMQCLLRNFHGFPSLRVDGNFGTVTENAVKAFQKNHGIFVDGQVGEVSWNHLHPDSDATLH